MLPRVGRTICHAISVSLSPSETGAPKGVAMSRCPLDSGVRSIMAGCSGHDGNHEHGVLFRNEIKTQLFPERRLPRAGTAQTGPAPTIAEGGPFRVHARLAPLSAAEQFGAWGGGGRGGGGERRKVPSFPSCASLITLQPARLCQPPLRRDLRNCVFPLQGHVSPPPPAQSQAGHLHC